MTQIDYWTDVGKPRNLATLTQQQRSQLLETLKQMEAKEWILRYKRKVKDLGKMSASGWWYQTLSDIEKKRGLIAANDLKRRMNNIKENQ
jgi:23S rRNA U2552 (ribose-2'-O)-methylase RlmE/FtsJ